MLVKANRICWDGVRCIKYHPGDQDDIDPLSPIAMYFDFPPGTEVYHKIKGKTADKDGKGGTPNIETTKLVPGGEDPDMFGCEICNAYEGTKLEVNLHQLTCIKKRKKE